jgi:hypothetical protein
MRTARWLLQLFLFDPCESIFHLLGEASIGNKIIK